MNILQKIFPSLFQLKSVPLPIGRTLYYLNGQITSSADNKKSYLTNGYDVNDIIYSIINLITEKVKVAPWSVYKIVDEGALKRYNGIMSRKDLSPDDLIRARDYKKKALDPYTKDTVLNELLKWPNEYQTFADLVADSSTYKLLTGDRLIWADRLSAGANKDKPTSLHLLPSQNISIVVTGRWPIKIVRYKLYLSDPMDFEKEDVLHDKYFNPACDIHGNHLLGLAPLKAALNLTDRSNAENRAALSSYQNGGPRTIIYVDEPQFSGEQKGAQAAAIKKILTSNDYVGPDNINKLAASGYKMGAVPVGLSPVDLDIIESEKWSLRRFCNVFGGVPSQLLNDPDNKVYNNTVEGEKALTSRCALPLLNSFRDQLNRKLGTDWGYAGKNLFVDYDMTVYSELQENMKEKWEWVERLPVPNGYKLDLMGLDHPEDQEDFMNQILVPSGYETSESYGESETDAALVGGDEEISEDEERKFMQNGNGTHEKYKAAVL